MSNFFTPLTSSNIVEPDGPLDALPCMMPGTSSQRAVLYRSDTLVAAVHRFEAYPDSFTFAIRLEGRGFEHGRFHFPFTPGSGWPDDARFDQPDDIFRVGVEFSDGSASEYLVPGDGAGPPIEHQGTSGSTGSAKAIFWVRHLPTPGTFTIHVAWPSIGLEECSAPFDADEIASSATDAELLL